MYCQVFLPWSIGEPPIYVHYHISIDNIAHLVADSRVIEHNDVHLHLQLEKRSLEAWLATGSSLLAGTHSDSIVRKK